MSWHNQVQQSANHRIFSPRRASGGPRYFSWQLPGAYGVWFVRGTRQERLVRIVRRLKSIGMLLVIERGTSELYRVSPEHVYIPTLPEDRVGQQGEQRGDR